MTKERNDHDVIDEDLYEEFDEEELKELVEIERQKALTKAQQEKDPKPKRPFPKWAFWLIALVMLFNVVALLPKTFSVPAVNFLITSAKLSTQDNIQTYKEAVVTIETGDSKGTGFAITADGTILTNHHVVEGKDSVTVAFPEAGLFSADIVDTFPSVDLAVLDIAGENLPHLKLADKTNFQPNDPIYFIGNPLSFNGIANKGTIIDYTSLGSWEEPVLMIDAPVYRGNSGSPVINQDGEVIGVVFATLFHDTHGRVGLFVPIDYYYEQNDQ
ncbi:S1C family serine protease [Virgibacillus salinus]|uniref:Trypsin-like peptidase domain-containing protein n=1 Tax=Virgibacillus salinus TaxID=553311 RepID=A0A1H1E9D8_9BACI|nr:serine protease [Virgibacillus salinus]SDQ85069.1 Trypsin-like peptidase domain-containing protein [Virgibacillus salinus]